MTKEELKKCRHEYYLINKERLNKKSKQYYLANKERIDNQNKEYAEKHKKELQEYRKRWYVENKENRKDYYADWYDKNKEKLYAYQKEYSENNKELIKQRKRKYNQEHKEQQNENARNRRHNNPSIKINDSIRKGIWKSLKGNKNGLHWELIVGYTLKDLIKHLEKQFVRGMSFDNYGKWHIDHKIPISAFNFNSINDIDFKRCWSLSNLQPLWANDNMKKNDSLEKDFQPNLAI